MSRSSVRAFATALLLFLLFSFSAPARADEADRGASEAPRRPSKVSVTTDATRPLEGLATVNGEFLLGRGAFVHGMKPTDVSTTVTLGGGAQRSNDVGPLPVWTGTCGDTCTRASVFLIGVQAVAYPIGSFDHGMQVGVQGTMRFLADQTRTLRTGTREIVEKTAFRWGDLEPGVFFGYKLTTRFGLTVNPQLGWNVSLLSMRGARPALNAGWSF